MEEKDTLLTKEQQKALNAVKDEVTKSMDTDFVEDLIKNNKYEFMYNDIKYRMRKLNYEEKQILYRERVKKFTELLRDSSYSLEKDIKKDYLARGIDIDGMQKKSEALEKQKEDLLFKLGELLKKDGAEQDCEVYKKEIEGIEKDQTDIAIEKQTLLEFSLENQVIVHLYNYMIFLSAEKQAGETWEKVFKTYDDFKKTEDDVLINKFAFLATMSFQGNI